MRLFKNKWFTRFARKENITDASLRELIRRIEAGSSDADLGGGVYKQRLSRRGQGQSGGYRIILCCKSGKRAFFVYGFAKSARENITPDEVRAFRKLADILLTMPERQLVSMVEAGDFVEFPNKEDLS